MLDFAPPTPLEAREPPEARGRSRGDVRLLVGRGETVTHHRFADLPELLDPGDLLVVNTSATLPAAVRLDRLAIHFSGPLSDGDWLVELRRRTGEATEPYTGGSAGEWFPMPGGATLTLLGRWTPRLWRARLDTDVLRYLREHGVPIRYGHVGHDWPLSAYRTVFGTTPGSAEMPSASRPFTTRLVTRLVTRGVLLTPLTLHTGVASPERDESPYPERYEVPAATAAVVDHVRERGGRVVAVDTTVVRALETATDPDGRATASAGRTSHVVTPAGGVRVVDGLLTGLHEPRSSHLLMPTAIAGEDLLERCYAEALDHGYLWHEFGDLNLLLR